MHWRERNHALILSILTFEEENDDDDDDEEIDNLGISLYRCSDGFCQLKESYRV